MSKKRKRAILISAPLALLMALVVYGKVQVDRLEANGLLLAETGKDAIQLLGEVASAVKQRDLAQVLDCYDEDYRNPDEGVWVERLESEKDGVRLYRWASESPQVTTLDELATRLGSFLDELDHLDQSKLKLAQVEEISSPDQAVVRSVLWLRGERRGGEPFEIRARLRQWLHRDEAGRFKITRQHLLGGETVVGPGQGFTDVAAESGVDFVARRNPLFDTPEWEPKRFEILPYGSAGVSAVDYDGDGWDDLFFADGAGARLYRNRGDGTFDEVTADAGLPTDLPGINVGLFADLDNDGDRDVLLSGFTQPSRLYRNDGDGTFTDVTDRSDLGENFVVVATAGDYDNDGLLDLYLGRYLDPRIHLPTTLFYTRNGRPNSLHRNLGNLAFADVTEEAGVGDTGLTLGVAWADTDKDGDQDLYVANDFGRNAFFVNNGDGTFTDDAEGTGTLDFGFGMSASFADVDNDLDLDLYISNVHSGQRWYGQAPSLFRYLVTSVRQGTIWEDLPVYSDIRRLAGDDWRHYGDHMVKGNSLFLNAGDGTFTDVAETASANPFGWYWGSGFLDYDNDGRLDVYAANGWISGKTHEDL